MLRDLAIPFLLLVTWPLLACASAPERVGTAADPRPRLPAGGMTNDIPSWLQQGGLLQIDDEAPHVVVLRMLLEARDFPCQVPLAPFPRPVQYGAIVAFRE